MCVCCACVCVTQMQLTPAFLSFVGNLRGSPGPKGIAVDRAPLLHWPSFLGVGSGVGVETFFVFFKLKDEQVERSYRICWEG